MALLDVPDFRIPDVSMVLHLNNTFAITASTHKLANFVRAPKAGTISHVRIATGLVTTGFDADVRLETIDQTVAGTPTGTLISAGANKVITIAGTDDQVWLDAALTTPPTVTRGQLLAVVLGVSSGSPNAVFPGFASVGYLGRQGFPYSTRYDGTTWTANATYLHPFLLRYSGDPDYTWQQEIIPARLQNIPTINTNSTPDEIGNNFQLPYRARASAAWARAGGSGDFDLVLYDSGGSVLASVSHDASMRQSANTIVTELFSSDVILEANTTYRIVMKPTTTTSCSVLSYLDLNRNASPGLTNWQAQQRTDAGAWTNLTGEQVASIGLVIDQVDTGGYSYGF